MLHVPLCDFVSHNKVMVCMQDFKAALYVSNNISVSRWIQSPGILRPAHASSQCHFRSSSPPPPTAAADCPQPGTSLSGTHTVVLISENQSGLCHLDVIFVIFSIVYPYLMNTTLALGYSVVIGSKTILQLCKADQRHVFLKTMAIKLWKGMKFGSQTCTGFEQ